MINPTFINPADLKGWSNATKTKGLHAKHSSAVISDASLLHKLLLRTIEGEIPLRQSMICIGVAGEPWQQDVSKLLQKYDINSITDDGWLVCEPKPGAPAVECVQLHTSALAPHSQFYIIGLWGKTLPDGTQNVQVGKAGDYICRSVDLEYDVWIVDQSIFENYYDIVETGPRS